jgi:hypothetical protein
VTKIIINIFKDMLFCCSIKKILKLMIISVILSYVSVYLLFSNQRLAIRRCFFSRYLLFFLPQIKKNSFTAFLNASLLFTFLIEIDKLFLSVIVLYEKLLVLHTFVFGVIKFKLYFL